MPFDLLTSSFTSGPLLGGVQAFAEGSGMSTGALRTGFGLVVFALLIVATALCVVSTLKPWGKGQMDAASLFVTLAVAITMLVTGGFLASYYLIA